MDFNKGFLWSKPPLHRFKQKTNTKPLRASLCCPASVLRASLMLSGCLLAFRWGMATS